eukprot:7229567-Ditylum_brightwellii.AAC.1
MSLLKQEVEQVMGTFKFVNTYSSGSKSVHWALSNIGELDINKLSTSMMNTDNTGNIQTTNAHPM